LLWFYACVVSIPRTIPWVMLKDPSEQRGDPVVTAQKEKDSAHRQ